MSTSITNVQIRPHQPPTVVNPHWPTATGSDDNDGTSFGDLLPEDQHSPDQTGTGDAAAKAKENARQRRAEPVPAEVAAPSPPAVLTTISVQQAMLAAGPANDSGMDPSGDSAVGGTGSAATEVDASGDSSSGFWLGESPAIPQAPAPPTAKPPLIAPHGPPPQTGVTETKDAQATIADPTAAADTVPAIAPIRQPPIVDPQPADGTTPLPDPTKLSPIRPHGPVSDDSPLPNAASPLATANATVAAGASEVTAANSTKPLPATGSPGPDASAVQVTWQFRDSRPQHAPAPVGTPGDNAAIPVTTTAQAQLATGTVAEISAGLLVNGASLAGTGVSGNVPSEQSENSQETGNQSVTFKSATGGTRVANVQTNVSATLSNNAVIAAADASSQEGATGWGTAFAGGRGDASRTGRAKDGDAATVGATPATFVTALSSANPAAVPAANGTAPSSGRVQVDTLQNLFETVQEAAAQAKLNGSGQVELRVKLQGVPDDVTVRINASGAPQSQVTFQTGSAELRTALEQGWNDLASPTSSTSASSASLTDSAEVSTAAGSDLYRESRRGSDDATPNRGSGARRWSGYA